MKKGILILMAILTMAVSANAGGINGKWKCSKEFLDGLGLHYDQMKGHYKFKKDGTFTLKINGVERSSAAYISESGNKSHLVSAKHRMIYIKVCGTYKIVNDSITTIVRQEDVKCYIQPGRELPDAPDANDGRYAAAMKEWKQKMYDREVFRNQVQAQTVKDELMHVWTWDKEPVTATKETLSVGEKATFRRK